MRIPILAALAFAAFGAFPSAASARCLLPAAGETARVDIAGAGTGAIVHTPRGYRDGGTPVPLVFLLHGSGGTGAAMLRDSKLAETSDAQGFILLAPDAGIKLGAGFAWNIPGVPTVAGELPSPQDRDDVAFIGALADALVQGGCADGERQYVTGLSGGGRMASWLGCVASDRFAAIAPVVGLRAGRAKPEDESAVDPETCQPNRAMPVMAFAGLKDNTNPLAGGQGMRWGYSMHAAEQRWAQLNRCMASPTTGWVARGIYEERYGDCADGSEVAARIDVNGAHSWVVDNDAMWTFFARHRRSGN
ncbi:alpha/beta hydrolase family esterase [Qipengyuania sp.]|uniref:alpha/beta hydrolase family esterase n=1 Tax=Qipengyuania sp. TaxID=2004515 RepID=UPI0035C7C6EE